MRIRKDKHATGLGQFLIFWKSDPENRPPRSHFSVLSTRALARFLHVSKPRNQATSGKTMWTRLTAPKLERFKQPKARR
jgi:hypothetical protein